MKCQLVFLSIFILFSCGLKKKNETEAIREMPYFNEDLYQKLQNYQKLYPIPAKNYESEVYIYLVNFDRTDIDTIVTFKRISGGYSLSNSNLTFGVYQNKEIFPTVIRDTRDFYSRNFINKTINDSLSLKSFSPTEGVDYPESFPPVYSYKVEGKKLILLKIDTVWAKWR